MASIASFSFSSPFAGAGISAARPSRVAVVSRRKVPISASCATAERSATSQSSLYDVLGIRTGASGQEIKAAYRRLARVLHPDAAAGGGAVRQSPSSDDFIRVHAAYSTLSDPEKRASYDRTLFRFRHSSPPARGSVYSGRRSVTRKWETDQCW